MIRVAKFASISIPFAAVAAIVLVIALAAGLAAPAAAASRHFSDHAKAPARHAGRPVYDVVPQGRAPVNSDDPSLTGGGSLGYNQNIYNW